MRTTLNIDDDLLVAIKEVAKRESRSAGSVVSSMLRRSLTEPSGGDISNVAHKSNEEFGFRPFPKRGGIVTNALINRLREEVGD